MIDALPVLLPALAITLAACVGILAASGALLALVSWSLMIDWCAAPRGRRYPEETDQ